MPSSDSNTKTETTGSASSPTSTAELARATEKCWYEHEGRADQQHDDDELRGTREELELLLPVRHQQHLGNKEEDAHEESDNQPQEGDRLGGMASTKPVSSSRRSSSSHSRQ